MGTSIMFKHTALSYSHFISKLTDMMQHYPIFPWSVFGGSCWIRKLVSKNIIHWKKKKFKICRLCITTVLDLRNSSYTCRNNDRNELGSKCPIRCYLHVSDEKKRRIPATRTCTNNFRSIFARVIPSAKYNTKNERWFCLVYFQI